MSNDYIVLDHHHDENEGVYRIVIGAPVETQVPKLDNDGRQQQAPARPMTTRRTKMKTVEFQVPVMEGDEPKLDAHGNPITETATTEVPVMNGDGPEHEEVPVFDDNGEPVMVPGEPLTETVVEHVPVEDFVFAADDDRWFHKSNGKRRKHEDVAKEQRELVRQALRARDRAAKRAERARGATQMPGVGETL